MVDPSTSQPSASESRNETESLHGKHIANWQRKAVMTPADGELKEDGNRRHRLRTPPPAWSFASSSPSSSTSCCASADCYQPHTSPSIRVRARAERSARRQPIGRDGPSRRLLANGQPDAPDVTHSALSVLCTRQARGRG